MKFKDLDCNWSHGSRESRTFREELPKRILKQSLQGFLFGSLSLSFYDTSQHPGRAFWRISFHNDSIIFIVDHVRWSGLQTGNSPTPCLVSRAQWAPGQKSSSGWHSEALMLFWWMVIRCIKMSRETKIQWPKRKRWTSESKAATCRRLSGPPDSCKC